MELETFILVIVIGILAAMVYSLRVLLVLEKRVAGMGKEGKVIRPNNKKKRHKK